MNSNLHGPDEIETRKEFARGLNEVRENAWLTLRQVSREARIPQSTVGEYFSGRHLPASPEFLKRILEACGVTDQKILKAWMDALIRVRHLDSKGTSNHVDLVDDDAENLLLRIYIPSAQLYSTETGRFLTLFREWMFVIVGQGVSQSMHSTASGQIYEFHIDGPIAKTDIQGQFSTFSNFLNLCAADPPAAVDQLAAANVGRVLAADLVARFSKEIRRLQIDLRHERERRILTIVHDLEGQLAEEDVDLSLVPRSQIDVLLENLIPEPSATASLALLGGAKSGHSIRPLTITINQQIVNAIESTVMQNVQGTVNLSADAKEMLSLIEQYGGQDAIALKSAVHEFEDVDARPDVRVAAKRRLKKFLSRIGESVQEVAIGVLEKYLESKVGI